MSRYALRRSCSSSRPACSAKAAITDAASLAASTASGSSTASPTPCAASSPMAEATIGAASERNPLCSPAPATSRTPMLTPLACSPTRSRPSEHGDGLLRSAASRSSRCEMAGNSAPAGSRASSLKPVWSRAPEPHGRGRTHRLQRIGARPGERAPARGARDAATQPNEAEVAQLDRAVHEAGHNHRASDCMTFCRDAAKTGCTSPRRARPAPRSDTSRPRAPRSPPRRHGARRRGPRACTRSHGRAAGRGRPPARVPRERRRGRRRRRSRTSRLAAP